ncbi:sigma factor-like helix-turn-helix DNA-binding protein [Nocardioides sp. CER19]|uniref:sigma factor-like helix-turn-helix DNA-binding protein n=1 Tax=Nocardioides sp. CER19 TaxID=3038538 RepID=UPI00244BCAEC|nr:sigma factor-like helix-turn-helix DNA-binding protein [Nocardioides sp. CER19]MDH2416577.1 sigma factor-like helix-turn-helix DNA-binding protein [Nocardioides sp. CER19]
MAGGVSVGFAEFVALRSPALQRTAYLIAGEVSAAEDLVHEALTRTYLAWPRLHDPYRAEVYARTALTTTAIAGSRRRGHHPIVPVAEPERVVRPADVDDSTWLWTCLLRLPVGQRAAIVLLHYEDLTEREAAETMGCGIRALRSQVADALTTLRPLVGATLLPQQVNG